MILQYLNLFSPIRQGETDSLEDAKALRDTLAKINPNDKFIVVEILS